MKILLVFLVLFATQIIHYKAQMHRNNNAFGITGIEKPEIKFWKNPFSNEKGMTAYHVSIEDLPRGEGEGKVMGETILTVDRLKNEPF